MILLLRELKKQTLKKILNSDSFNRKLNPEKDKKKW